MQDCKKQDASKGPFVGSEKACRDVISHVYGSSVARELLTVQSAEGDVDAIAIMAVKEQDDDVDGALEPRFQFAYSAFGLVSNGSYAAPKNSAAFVLFINDRLVDCSSLKRAVEGVYADILPRGAKPFVYLAIDLPGPHVDVNVHPTKREVAFLHEDRLCEVLAEAVKKVIMSASASRTFYAAALLPHFDLPTNQNGTIPINSPRNSKLRKKQSLLPEDDDAKKKRPPPQSPAPSSKKKAYDPKRLVRTDNAAPAGALEPFLVSTQEQQSQTPTNAKGTPTPQHENTCELSSVDMTLPGAFASVICRCRAPQTIAKLVPPASTKRPKKVISTECSLASIHALRQEITMRAHQELASKLRESVYVGYLSSQRSLIQWNIDLMMINHYELARELFYQLALARFDGGTKVVQLGHDGVHVKELIQHAMNNQEPVQPTSKDDADEHCCASPADQAVQCLSEDHRIQMLCHYFSIKFKMEGTKPSVLKLMALPVLLEGHVPCPHALPTFLLRLATEIDWNDERRCFEGICTELGAFYAEIPFSEDPESIASLVRHTIFPALSYLLLPSKEFVEDGSVVKLANLTSLYKVFERC